MWLINKHSGFDEPLFNKCVHRDIPPRKWLKVGMGILVIFEWIFISSDNCVLRKCETHLIFNYAFLVKYERFAYHRLYSTIFPGTLAYDKLVETLTENSLVKGIKQASPLSQTSMLEGFHSALNYFAPKMIAYSYVGMYCRYLSCSVH